MKQESICSGWILDPDRAVSADAPSLALAIARNSRSRAQHSLLGCTMVGRTFIALRRHLAVLVAAILVAACATFWSAAASAAGRLGDYLSKAEPSELVPGANRFGPLQGDPSIAPAYKDDQLLGYAYLNSEFANATGYSGKPIQLLVGIDPNGRSDRAEARRAQGADRSGGHSREAHPGSRQQADRRRHGARRERGRAGAASRHRQRRHRNRSGDRRQHRSIRNQADQERSRSAPRATQAASAAPQASKTIDPAKSEIRDWQSLVGDGSVRRLPFRSRT